MTLRTKSKEQQWMVWLFAALASLAVYIVLSLYLYGTIGWDPFDVRCHRLMLPLVVMFILVARETRWDGVRRGKKKGKVRGEGEEKVKVKVRGEGEEKVKVRGEEKVKVRGEGEEKVRGEGEQWNVSNEFEAVRQRDIQNNEEDILCSPSPFTFTSSQPSDALTGEELFNQARDIPHQPIPDSELDGEYLDLLGKSAAAGYAPALAKLGEYAIRRAAWVEAYYWLKQAQRNGMHGLSPTLCEIRNQWAKAGFPDEEMNVNEIYTPEFGSIGRAFLNIDSGRESGSAKEFLKANFPELL